MYIDFVKYSDTAILLNEDALPSLRLLLFLCLNGFVRCRIGRGLHQVGLKRLIALEIRVDKEGPDLNAVLGIDHPLRLAGQADRPAPGRQAENNLKSRPLRIDPDLMPEILGNDNLDAAQGDLRDRPDPHPPGLRQIDHRRNGKGLPRIPALLLITRRERLPLLQVAGQDHLDRGRQGAPVFPRNLRQGFVQIPAGAKTDQAVFFHVGTPIGKKNLIAYINCTNRAG